MVLFQQLTSIFSFLSAQCPHWLKQTLMKLTTRVPEEGKRRVVCEGPYKECSKTYFGETKRMLKVSLGEHKQVVKGGDPKKGIAVHAHETHYGIDWNVTPVKKIQVNCRKRTIEAIQIKTNSETMNLDSSLQLPSMWNSILNPPQTIYLLLHPPPFPTSSSLH